MAEEKRAKYFTVAEAGADFHHELLRFHAVTKWLVARLHPRGIGCPKCSKDLPGPAIARGKWETREQVNGPFCNTKFTTKTGALLEGSKLEPREVLFLANYLAPEISPCRIAERLQIVLRAVRSWRQKFHVLPEVGRA